MSNENAKSIIEACESLRSDRASFDNLYEDCARFCLPREQDLTSASQVDGQEKPQPVNGIGVRSAQMLASGLYSNTVSLGSKWFSLRPHNEELENLDAVQEWWGKVAERCIKKIQNSNFALQYHEMLQVYCTFGIGVLNCELRDGDLVFRSFGLGGVYVAENDKGLVDTVYRRFSFTAKQAVQAFGYNEVNPVIRQDADDPKKQNTKYEFIHAVYPRLNRKKGRKDQKNKPFASVYVDVKHEVIVRESGYDSFPYAVPRFFKKDGESYGRSPAMNALPDLRMLNRAEADYINAVEMAVTPPLFLPEGSDQRDIDLTPGAVNYYSATQGAQPYEYGSASRIDLGKDFLERKEQAVRESFYVDLFMALEERKNMSATEVVERVNEKIQSITPVVSRLQSEFFEQVINRVVLLLAEDGQLEPPPGGVLIDGSLEMSISYTTRLDTKLAQVEIETLMRAVQQAASIAEAMAMFDELRATFDMQRIARYLARESHVDTDVIRSEADAEEYLKQLIEQRMQQAQQQQIADKIKPVDLQKRGESGAPLDMMAQGATGPMA